MKIRQLTSSGSGNPIGSSFGAVWEMELLGGEATQPDQHEQIEGIYCCVEGEGRIVVAERAHPLPSGEIFYVPRLTNHWLENASVSARLRCLAVQTQPTDSQAGSADGPGEDNESEAATPAGEA
ncbi:MAG: cupin domain-containing protein, partial [Planctomycetota bacterium]